MTDLLAEHDRLRQYIAHGIDLLALEDEFMMTPRVMEEVGQLAANAEEAKNIAKHNLDLVVAEASDRIRQPLMMQSAAQGRIDSELKIMVPQAPDVRAAREAYITAMRAADLCDKLYSSIKEHGRLLGKAADMVNAGWITQSSLLAKRGTAQRKTVTEGRQPPANAHLITRPHS